MKQPTRTKTKKYLLTIPLPLWEALLTACNNEWGRLAQFIREAIQEKIERESAKQNRTQS
jgi:hypothetical protein